MVLPPDSMRNSHDGALGKLCLCQWQWERRDIRTSAKRIVLSYLCHDAVVELGDVDIDISTCHGRAAAVSREGPE